MKRIRNKSTMATLAIAVMFWVGQAQAGTTSIQNFSGNFVLDDDVMLVEVTLASDGFYRFESYAYAGGTRTDGSVITSGGFDTIFSLFDSLGGLIRVNDDGTNRFDPNSNRNFDAAFSILLTAGTYTLAVTQYSNFASGALLSDGFDRVGEGNFTPGLFNCAASAFCDVSGVAPFNERTNFFAGDITLNPVVPLPAALPLLFAALVGLGFWTKRAHT